MTFEVLGVDYDSYKATLCLLPFDGEKPLFAQPRFRKNHHSGADHAWAALGRVLDEFRHEVVRATIVRASVIWIERGFGQSRRADFDLGAFYGAIRVGFQVTSTAPVNSMDLREWKRLVTSEAFGKGNGNAKKEVANQACRAIAAAAGVDVVDWSPDMLDAYGICWAGRELNRRALGEAGEVVAGR